MFVGRHPSPRGRHTAWDSDQDRAICEVKAPLWGAFAISEGLPRSRPYVGARRGGPRGCAKHGEEWEPAARAVSRRSTRGARCRQGFFRTCGEGMTRPMKNQPICSMQPLRACRSSAGSVEQVLSKQPPRWLYRWGHCLLGVVTDETKIGPTARKVRSPRRRRVAGDPSFGFPTSRRRPLPGGRLRPGGCNVATYGEGTRPAAPTGRGTPGGPPAVGWRGGSRNCGLGYEVHRASSMPRRAR